MPPQNAFMVPTGNQFNNSNMIGNVPNVSSLLHQSFVNGGPSSGPGSTQRGLTDGGAESDPLSSVGGNGIGFSNPSSSYKSTSVTSNPNSSGQVQGQQSFSNTSGSQVLTDQQRGQHLDPQNFQHNQQQFSVPSNSQRQPHQKPPQQYQAMRGGLGGVGSVKVEPQVTNEQAPQKLHVLRNLGSAELDAQQLQGMRSAGPVKVEPQNSGPSLFLHQQQQLLLSRQLPHAAGATQIFHQQRLMQMQQHQQRSPSQPQFQPQNLPNRAPVKPVYEPGMCARRLTHYLYQRRNRPEDNNIEFWRKFVAEYFVPNATKKLCVSMYGSDRQTTGVSPQDVWHCEICNRMPGRGFEVTAEILPRVFKIYYESGTLEELLYVDMPQEFQNSSGQIVLHYEKATQKCVFEQLRIVRDGQLRIVFSPDLKICSWVFCARRHQEYIPRRLLIPQVSQLIAAAQKCQAPAQNASSNVSASEQQNNCNMVLPSALQLAKTLEVPLVNELGYPKRHVRCLQISEVVSSMKDLMNYSLETGTGPMESLIKFHQRKEAPVGSHGQQQQQQTNNNPVQTAAMELASSNGKPSGSNLMPATSSSDPIVALLHQNSIRQPNPISSANGPYRGAMPQTQPPFLSPRPSSSNNPQPTPQASLSGAQVNSPNISPQQQPSLSCDADVSDSQTSVKKIRQDMMMSPKHGAGTAGGDMKNVNGTMNSIVGHQVANGNTDIGGSGFRNMSNGLGHSMNGLRAAGENDPMGQQLQDLGNQLLSDLGTIDDFNDLQFDWKSSP